MNTPIFTLYDNPQICIQITNNPNTTIHVIAKCDIGIQQEYKVIEHLVKLEEYISKIHHTNAIFKVKFNANNTSNYYKYWTLSCSKNIAIAELEPALKFL